MYYKRTLKDETVQVAKLSEDNKFLDVINLFNSSPVRTSNRIDEFDLTEWEESDSGFFASAVTKHKNYLDTLL